MEDGAHRVPQLEPPTAGCTTSRNMGDRLMTARYSHGAPGSYRFRLCIPALCILAFSLGLETTPARGQAPAIPNPVRPGLTAQTTENSATATTGAATNPATGISQQELQQLAAEAAENRANSTAPTAGLQSSLNFLALLVEGGVLMIPIAIMSLLVVAVALERFFALRRGRLFPAGLRRELRRATAASVTEEFSPPLLFQASERYPSVAGRILQDVLLKLGRPIPEAEMTINESTQREADAMYNNVRWLTLAAAVTPLIGLLGTVWGMIIAFYNTTQLGSGMNKAEFLAEGIYVALVTTLGGLAVAIPAAIFAHYFEGRITKTLAKIDAEIRRLMPAIEALEGKSRYVMSPAGLVERKLSKAPPPPPATSPK
ncbi:MotA/TolQ/ExbB proton channel family protein [Aureliella helgolandensis]|uniref:Colicin uptake protein TolQ n=1 Tax=Aureliella helgolandensis TaxID=2527968 RepID=A0A518GF07_9BACT|nr:MotA/TolQ/ExbB proton channel family protein [Aureliella helgolandensis]QDV27179.1 colicin uptake protein TolQ [Aureliella helgolandensis]